MSLPVVLREVAQTEFDEAVDYYNARDSERSEAFVERVQEVFDRIAANPLLHAIAFADVRKATVSRFPYCVYYRAEESRVEVIAVFHTSRDPSIWQSRV